MWLLEREGMIGFVDLTGRDEMVRIVGLAGRDGMIGLEDWVGLG